MLVYDIIVSLTLANTSSTLLERKSMICVPTDSILYKIGSGKTIEFTVSKSTQKQQRHIQSEKLTLEEFTAYQLLCVRSW